jgi:hypothetical protein
MALELATEARMVRIKDGTYVFRIELLSLGREADEVAVEDGDDLGSSRATTSTTRDAPHIPHRRNPLGSRHSHSAEHASPRAEDTRSHSKALGASPMRGRLRSQ